MTQPILRFACTLLLSAGTFVASAQTDPDYLAAHPHATAAHFMPYPDSVPGPAPAPEGFRPFYMSHYGRHGSRYHVSSSVYRKALRVLKKSHEQQLLTPLGESLYDRVERLTADAEGRTGSLSPRGAVEHRAIAGRMVRNFPEIFAPDGGEAPRIVCRATQVPRCILSMAANNERLKELNPALRIERIADIGDADTLRHTPFSNDHSKEFTSRATEFIRPRLDCSRFAASVVRGDVRALMNDEELLDFARNVYALYAIAGCSGPEDIDLDDIFTHEELVLLWKAQNLRNYLVCSASPQYGARVVPDARPLLRDIIRRADAALAGDGPAADLRFGHDVALSPLLSLIAFDGRDVRCDDPERLHEVWCDFLVIPMAANFQMIFYRNAAGEILVQMLHNERCGRLPIATDRFPFYRWNDVRDYLLTKL